MPLWLPADSFGTLARYLGEYLRTGEVFRQLQERLLKILKLQVSDQGARRHALREYVQLVLNDFVMNPGPSKAPLDTTIPKNGHNLGLMGSLVRRWRQRLPLALASAAGKHTQIPDGNEELKNVLSHY